MRDCALGGTKRPASPLAVDPLLKLTLASMYWMKVACVELESPSVLRPGTTNYFLEQSVVEVDVELICRGLTCLSAIDNLRPE